MAVILALDVGMKRTGVARANTDIRIATPLTVLHDSETLASDIIDLAEKEAAVAIVVGLPRNLQGQPTEQTRYVEEKAAEVERLTDIPLYFMDEALTSNKAEKELAARKKPYSKEDIDMLAATYILQDYLETHTGELHV